MYRKGIPTICIVIQYMYVILMRGIVEIIIKLENVISNTNISEHPPPQEIKKKKKKKHKK